MAMLILLCTGLLLLAAGCTTGDGKVPAPPLNPGDNSSRKTGALSAPVSTGEMVAFVQEAVAYARANGKSAVVAEFNNQSGRFVDGELYIFAYDTKGNTLALPFQHDLLGKNRLNTTDANGTAFIRELISTALSGGGFVHYYYLDPADNYTVKPKLSYVLMVDQDWIIGAGIYETNETART